MAEAEWLACDEPTPMLESLGTAANIRKLRLFCCACCHRAAGLLTEDYVRHARNALTVFERHLEGQATDRDLEGAWGGVYGDAMEAAHAIAHPGEADYYAISAAANAVDSIRRNDLAHAVSYAADAVAYDALARSGSPALARITTEWTRRFRLRALSQERWDRDQEDVRRLPEYTDARAAERRKQCVMLRDIFGNPFRPATLHPSWLMHTVRMLAEGIYADRAFDCLPILADALQDAGCENWDILNHCRGEGPHVRGCWVVDQVLNKE
jgi:hypothetical protein